MLKEQQVIVGFVEYMDEFGNGVLKSGKDNVLVRHVLIKEKVKVKVKRKIAQGYTASLLEIIEKHPSRVKVSCGIYEQCGSCHLLHIKENEQAKLKTQKVQELCKKAQLKLTVHPILSMKEPFHYRNKIIIGFQKDRNRHLKAGFYEEFTHHIIPYERCLLHPVICDEIIGTLTALMEKFRIEPYDENRRSGLLRHVLIRYGTVSKQIMVVLVLNQNVFPVRKSFVEALLKKHPEITTIIQNTNTRKTSVVLGDQERTLYGKGYIEDELCHLTFRISSKSFYQINHAQTEVLYQHATDMITWTGKERVLDAYCGIGTIGMSISSKAKEVVGVEINQDAIRDANSNAKANHMKNIRFVCEDASSFMRKAAVRKEHFDIVIMDPPRSGSSEEFLKSVASLKPRQILYISCNPQTQMRDLQCLEKLGYHANELTPVDMFPQTESVESICLIERL